MREIPPLLAAALTYASRGWRVIPLHHRTRAGCSCDAGAQCKTPAKHPRVTDWIAQGSLDPRQVTEWWHATPRANVGIVTGIGSQLAVLDIDPRNGGEVALEDFVSHYGPLPETAMVLTGGGGQHYYFSLDRPLPSLHPAHGVDLQMDGAQVVAPPSATTAAYYWEVATDPLESTEVVLAPLPSWLRDLAEAKAAQQREGIDLPDVLPQVGLHHLHTSSRIKYLIRTGEDPDNPARYPSRSEALFAVLTAMVHGGHDDATMAAVVMDHQNRISEKVWEQKNARSPFYIQQTRQWVAREIGRAKAKLPPRSPTAPVIPDMGQSRNGLPPPSSAPPAAMSAPEDTLPYGDVYNARRLLTLHGADLCFCGPWDTWLTWGGTHWERDQVSEVMRRAKATVLTLLHEARAALDDATSRMVQLAAAETTTDEERLQCKALQKRANAFFAHAAKSLNHGPLTAMVKQAQSEAGVSLLPEVFDTDPWLLNVSNGTLDLRTGMLRPHAHADRLTKGLRFAFDAAAQCPTWERFLWHIMGGSQGDDDPEMSTAALETRHTQDARAKTLIGFLQRAIGYSLTGDTSEQCLFILHGPTKTGKTTFLETIGMLLGPYAQQAEMSTFLHKEKDQVRNDLADLAASRFVSAVEVQEGKRLAESLVKQLTGADRVKARFLFQEYFTYKPQFKVFLGTNHKPVIHDTDDAIWERIRLVPFTVHIPRVERDKRLTAKLEAELPGILAWAVRGCLLWQKHGLHEPEAVEQATLGYRTEMDHLGQFIGDCCVLGPQYQVKPQVLYDAYYRWCVENAQEPMTGTMLGKRLTDRGLPSERTNVVRWRVGIGLQEKAQGPGD